MTTGCVCREKALEKGASGLCLRCWERGRTEQEGRVRQSGEATRAEAGKRGAPWTGETPPGFRTQVMVPLAGKRACPYHSSVRLFPAPQRHIPVDTMLHWEVGPWSPYRPAASRAHFPRAQLGHRTVPVTGTDHCVAVRSGSH